MGGAREFAGTADVYQQARRGYPVELRDHLVARRLARPGAHVMDLGAGTGQLSVLLADAVDRVTAVEPEPDMVRVGRAATAGCSNVVWVRAKAEDLVTTFGDDRAFDIVVIGNAFQHMHRAQLLVDLDRLVSADGGVAVCASSVPVWLQDAAWSDALRVALRDRFGIDPHRSRVPDQQSDAAVLVASPFSEVTPWSFERHDDRSVDSIVGEVISSSSGRIDADGAEALRHTLEPFTSGGRVREHVVTTALIATRPARP